jgi:hypothetical protein
MLSVLWPVIFIATSLAIPARERFRAAPEVVNEETFKATFLARTLPHFAKISYLLSITMKDIGTTSLRLP